MTGTLNMLKAAVKSKVRNFIFASSSSVYGSRKDNVPFKETDKTDKQISPYGATKKAGEELCYVFHNLYDLNISCLRFFNVYGARGRPNMAPYKFTNLIYHNKPIEMYGDGTSKRDYTYIKDVVNGILSALDKDFQYEVFNIGNGQSIKLRYFISVIGSLLGKKARIIEKPDQPGDVQFTCADIAKSKKKLGYNPKTTIEEGMKNFVGWYKKCMKK